MAFDVLSFVIGQQAGKASGGSSGGGKPLIYKQSVKPSDGNNITVIHNLGVIPDLVVLCPSGAGNIGTLPSRVIQIVGCTKEAREKGLSFSQNTLWYVKSSGSELKVDPYGVNMTTTALYPVNNATETSVSFYSGASNVYFDTNSYYDVCCFAGLV